MGVFVGVAVGATSAVLCSRRVTPVVPCVFTQGCSARPTRHLDCPGGGASDTRSPECGRIWGAAVVPPRQVGSCHLVNRSIITPKSNGGRRGASGLTRCLVFDHGRNYPAKHGWTGAVRQTE